MGVIRSELSTARAFKENSLPIERINPLAHPAWSPFVAQHPAASIFHTAGWLQALRRTYQYEPAALAIVRPDHSISAALVYCRVDSWLTGRRLVSLPFCDHCDPLVSDEQQFAELSARLIEMGHQSKCKYVELRPSNEQIVAPRGFQQSEQFSLHRVDLRPGASAIFKTFHRDSIQRKIRKAEREGLTIQKGRDADLMREFYGLMLHTRRRHGLPPQPIEWFSNLAESLGEALLVRVAYKDGKAIAGILTLEHQATLTYKYGASDERFHNLGGMPFLFWDAIQDATGRGFEQMDMGRSELDNTGLSTFKERWGATATSLTYWKSPAPRLRSHPSRYMRLVHYACSHSPNAWLRVLGTLVYRHAA